MAANLTPDVEAARRKGANAKDCALPGPTPDQRHQTAPPISAEWSRFLLRLSVISIALAWLLSSLDLLSRSAYLAGISLGAAGLFRLQKATLFRFRSSFTSVIRTRTLRRARRSLPVFFHLILIGSAIGACLHAPNNFDALSYRMPRLLFWVTEGQWHWIHSPFVALNHTFPNYEWLSTPFYFATGSFRAVVLINLIGFSCLPRLTFGILVRLGCPGRLAWDWMWLLPSAHLIAMQAGGIGNDLAGMVFGMAALSLALNYAAKQNTRDLVDCILAFGVCSGIKTSNVLLFFPIAWILWRRISFRGVRIALPVAVLAGVLVSGAIPMALNHAHTGTILGTDRKTDQTEHPVAGWAGNGMILANSLVTMPVQPIAGKLNAIGDQWISTSTPGKWIRERYDKFDLDFSELPQEEGGGVGIGLTLCLIVMWLHRNRRGRPWNSSPAQSLSPFELRVTTGLTALALVLILSRLGTGAAVPRNLLPYFPFIALPVIRWLASANLHRLRSWKLLTSLTLLSIAPGILCTPSRPLLPMESIFEAALRKNPDSRFLQRGRDVYRIYRLRADIFEPYRRRLPANVDRLGWMTTGEEPSASLWRPFGQRTLVPVLSDQDFIEARRSGVRWYFLSEHGAEAHFGRKAESWIVERQAVIRLQLDVRIFGSAPSEKFYLLEFPPETDAQLQASPPVLPHSPTSESIDPAGSRDQIESRSK
jgi:hypothetical protein